MFGLHKNVSRIAHKNSFQGRRLLASSLPFFLPKSLYTFPSSSLFYSSTHTNSTKHILYVNSLQQRYLSHSCLLNSSFIRPFSSSSGSDSSDDTKSKKPKTSTLEKDKKINNNNSKNNNNSNNTNINNDNGNNIGNATEKSKRSHGSKREENEEESGDNVQSTRDESSTDKVKPVIDGAVDAGSARDYVEAALEVATRNTNSSDPSDMNETNNALERIEIPKEYPQVLAVPLAGRPLFPGFYKSITIKDPEVVKAIQKLIDTRQPYIGVFCTKDPVFVSDVIKNESSVYKVGVFAQITNIYQSGTDEPAFTIVLYPHRRIRMTHLIPPPSKGGILRRFKQQNGKENDSVMDEKTIHDKEQEAEIVLPEKSFGRTSQRSDSSIGGQVDIKEIGKHIFIRYFKSIPIRNPFFVFMNDIGVYLFFHLNFHHSYILLFFFWNALGQLI